ncbi:helix-turn-helix domain-containing protein [Mucilaginibacter sp. SMC90]|uniref:helix-turn-helix domain-containing protein n=1 Tax=Mucilaginibacter sp. SMC90 TaxID=2929803 RepID=UPI001FB36858|nr:helix-turn-helix domain-containing protein [Mucilaginibacter sp. SMC90]UOE51362.1 helix-turn-helix domain-containing protein [Mucilaginibacter sp. SMC90]
MNPKQLVTLEDLTNFKAELFTEIGRLIKTGKGQPEKKWLKTREVRKLLGVSPGKLQTMRKSGVLTYMRIGGSLYYDQEDIDKMFEKNKIGPKDKQ